MAYPLPYGEYLGEVEALHLILAHDLYTELRQIISHVQVRFLVICKISIFSVMYSRIFALHQHDLFSLLFQGLEAVKELPVMLLVMMLAFFRADPPSNVSLNSSSQSSSAFGNTTNNSSKTKSNGQSKKPRMVLQQPEKVMRIHDYYMHKLQVRSFKGMF